MVNKFKGEETNNVLIFIGRMVLFVLLMAIVFWLPAYLFEVFGWQFLSQFFDNQTEYRKNVATISFILFLPPFFLYAFSAMPEEVQNDAKTVGFSLVVLLDWVGRGFLFAVGAAGFYYLFIN